MSLISVSSNKTRVHLSPDNLSTITSEKSYNNNDIQSDIAVLPIYKSFIQIFKDKESWINICKIKKQEDEKETIQVCVKNLSNDNLSSIAAAKKKVKGLCFATGYTNGQIKIRELQTNKLVKEFSTHSSSVFFLDFNSTDEHLASVHEDGLINIYGMQTSIKMHSYTLDNQSTLARFHPQKRSLLGVASFSGKVNLLDIYAKKTIFKTDGHNAPCSDIAMFDDFVLSSGYDSMVKIYDLRKKSPGIEIQACYGWTSISVSNCGVYFVGGNMKGELISYDLRYIKKPLSSARIENSNHKISRVAFLSNDDDSSMSVDLSKAVRQSLCKVEEEIDEKKQTTNDDFIEDILGFQRGRISDFSSNAINHGTRVSTSASRRSSIRFSDAYGRNILEPIRDFPSPVQSQIIELDDSHVNKSKRRTSGKRTSTSSLLNEINEEISENKENDCKSSNLDLPNTAPRYSSTPTIPKEPNLEVIELDGDESFKSVQNGDNFKLQTPAINNNPVNFDIRKEFDALSEKIHTEVGGLNLDQNMRFIEMMSHIGEQSRKMQSRIQMVEECIAVLMSDDFKINLINNLQAENEELRRQINELSCRSSK